MNQPQLSTQGEPLGRILPSLKAENDLNTGMGYKPMYGEGGRHIEDYLNTAYGSKLSAEQKGDILGYSKKAEQTNYLENFIGNLESGTYVMKGKDSVVYIEKDDNNNVYIAVGKKSKSNDLEDKLDVHTSNKERPKDKEKATEQTIEAKADTKSEKVSKASKYMNITYNLLLSYDNYNPGTSIDGKVPTELAADEKLEEALTQHYKDVQENPIGLNYQLAGQGVLVDPREQSQMQVYVLTGNLSIMAKDENQIAGKQVEPKSDPLILEQNNRLNQIIEYNKNSRNLLNGGCKTDCQQPMGLSLN